MGYNGFHGSKEVAKGWLLSENKGLQFPTIAVRYYSDPKLMFTVSKHCFIPKPDVGFGRCQT